MNKNKALKNILNIYKNTKRNNIAFQFVKRMTI